MKKTLAPIIHKDSYTIAIERVLNRYFASAIFDPLLDILEESKVPDFRENAASWQAFPSELGSLGVPRRAMPQIRTADHEELAEHLASLGIGALAFRELPGALKPSQPEFSPAKVEAAMDRASDDPILASADGYIIDGHHRWFARLIADPKTRIRVVRFDEDARPLIAHVATFRRVHRENARHSPIQTALDSGRVWYADGAFYGAFSGDTARELRALGATFDAHQGAFLIPSGKLPFDLRTAVEQSLERSRAVHERVQHFLEAAEANLKVAVSGIDVDQTLSAIRADLYRQFERSVSGLDFIEVAPDFTPEINASIAREFTNNLDLYVKNFLSTEIPEMREEVAKNAFAGYRADRLARTIEQRYGVTKRKAAFLADQETGLLISRYRQEKAASIGATTYEWSTSHDERVRPDHRRLDGTIHSFDSPPITNLNTGARNNPGEDFRCRCVAMAIIEIPKERTNAVREFNCARIDPTVNRVLS